MTSANPNDETCPRCFVGRLHEGKAPFTTLMDNTVLCIPDARAFTCDICDYREFDDALVEWVSRTVGMPGTSESSAPMVFSKVSSNKS